MFFIFSLLSRCHCSSAGHSLKTWFVQVTGKALCICYRMLTVHLYRWNSSVECGSTDEDIFSLEWMFHLNSRLLVSRFVIVYGKSWTGLFYRKPSVHSWQVPCDTSNSSHQKENCFYIHIYLSSNIILRWKLGGDGVGREIFFWVPPLKCRKREGICLFWVFVSVLVVPLCQDQKSLFIGIIC